MKGKDLLSSGITSAPLMIEADLLTLLRDCYTALGRNVVEANLIKSATLTFDTEAPGAGIPGVPPRYRAAITLLAPTSDETATAQLAAQIENRLLGTPAISAVSLAILPALFSIL
ncbi:DUF59 domain-containing protein [Granulicella paludicola]|uniref:DUF59 domain-containing protein n=1 Tax=Granulicella paludicola TaxID=474951 RepID=UPI0021DF9D4D|nr:DUF59 domain-containing protein [Granulicella paludicola]